MELTFLGTGCMVPTKDRNVSAIFLSYKNKGILIDCGEGTQRQMNIAGINRNKVNYVFLTHWHGDHVSGLIGLIQTIGNQQAQNEEIPVLHIYGPKETEKRIEHLLQTCIFDNKLHIEVHELIPRKTELMTILDTEDFIMTAALMDHGVPCLAYNFVEKDIRKISTQKINEYKIPNGPLIGALQRGETVQLKISSESQTITPEMVSSIKKGIKLAFILDTGLCENAIAIAKNADLLICEASYASHIEEKAENNKHLTAKQAALIANNAEVKKLIITHISQRYKHPDEVLEDARDVFATVEVAYDFMKIKI